MACMPEVACVLPCLASGAAPQLLYASLLDAVAQAGYTVVATPYAVTFRLGGGQLS